MASKESETVSSKDGSLKEIEKDSEIHEASKDTIGEIASHNEDRITKIMEALASDKPLPGGKFKYTEGWDFDKLEEELKQHPFFMTEMPKEGEPIPPLIEAFQQLKYSPEENSPNELALNYKEDGLFQFKLKKYRIATTCFSEAIRHAESQMNEEPDKTLTAQLYNNRAAAQFYIGNYRSCLQDCDKALALQPDYVKPLMKALDCCLKLEKWDQTLEYCEVAEKIIPKNPAVDKIRFAAKRGKRMREVQARQSNAENREKDLEIGSVLSKLRLRGVKLTNENFLNDSAAETGKKVVVGKDGKLQWPVLFYYPQFSISDFIEGFHEESRFIDHLVEILDNDRPSWDVGNEYHSATVDLYFIDITTGSHVKIDIQDTLANVLKHSRYHLPTNGVPGFFVMARDNEMCKVILERSA